MTCSSKNQQDTDPSSVLSLETLSLSMVMSLGEIAFDDIIYLAVPRTKSVTFKQRSLVVSGPQLWNSLPTVIKMENSMVGFKRKIKTHLFKLTLICNKYCLN